MAFFFSIAVLTAAQDRQLLALVPNALRSRAGGFEGHCHLRDIQRAITTGGCEEGNQEAV